MSPSDISRPGSVDGVQGDTGVLDPITWTEGGITTVRGIRAAGVWAGFRRNPLRKDLALVVADEPVRAAGVFTKNSFCAPPITVSRKHISDSTAQAIIINSGNANAATGEAGMQVAIDTARLLGEQLGCDAREVLVASTGVIGVNLPFDRFEQGVPQAVSALGSSDGKDLASGHDAACAIMTTDRVAKEAALTFTAVESDGTEVICTIGGMVKGSGMIQPDMATLLAVLTTDADLTPEAIDLALHDAVDHSFNKVTIDSDTSTNDCVFLMATGAGGGKTINPVCPVYPVFARALRALCENLARQVARDGEGATKLITVDVVGGVDEDDADRAARAVANSPLVKTAIAGHDTNWGRIAMALGKSGARFEQEHVSIDIMGLPVCREGLAVSFDEAEALKRFDCNDEIIISVDLGAGTGEVRIWTCDMTHDYISINGDYRT